MFIDISYKKHYFVSTSGQSKILSFFYDYHDPIIYFENLNVHIFIYSEKVIWLVMFFIVIIYVSDFIELQGKWAKSLLKTYLVNKAYFIKRYINECIKIRVLLKICLPNYWLTKIAKSIYVIQFNTHKIVPTEANPLRASVHLSVKFLQK